MVTKSASKLALGALATASTASGAIVVFDVQESLISAGYGQSFTMWNISIANGTFLFDSSGDGQSLSVFAMSYYDVLQVSGSVGVSTINSTFALQVLGLAAEVSGDLSFGIGTQGLTSTPLGVSQYVGLRLTENSQNYYGWLELVRTDASHVLIKQFAFNNVAGESILVGQTPAVPEASTLGFAGGLFGLVALAHARRRQRKQAAASEKFLSLAAGEKLN